MSLYRKKPVVISATQWFKNGDHPQDNCRVITPVPGDGEPYLSEGEVVRRFNHPDIDGWDKCQDCGDRMVRHGWIDNPDGGHVVCPGDYIITDAMGEIYPCKPGIFTASYEMVIP